MSVQRASIVGTAVLAVLVAACGGGGTVSSAPSQAASAAASEAPPSQAASAAASEAPSQAASPAVSQGGGSTVANACELVTAEEAAGVLGFASTTTMATPGDVSYCIYSDPSGAAAAATTLMARGGSGAFAAWKSGAGVQQVDGLGDDAVFDPSTASLFMLKGDAVFSVAAGTGAEDEAQRLEWAKAFAEIAIGRL